MVNAQNAEDIYRLKNDNQKLKDKINELQLLNQSNKEQSQLQQLQALNSNENEMLHEKVNMLLQVFTFLFVFISRFFLFDLIIMELYIIGKL